MVVVPGALTKFLGKAIQEEQNSKLHPFRRAAAFLQNTSKGKREGKIRQTEREAWELVSDILFEAFSSHLRQQVVLLCTKAKVIEK